MSKETILNEDWADYDDRKKKEHDKHFFSCEEEWEVDYLVKKIHGKFPSISTDKIRTAIKLCCNSVPAPRSRKTFVECVMNRLGFGDDHSGGGNPPPNPGPGPQNPPTAPSDRKVGL
ncbi:hypothetical protein [Flavobacterium subsaxonicum]|uniref:Uncharacterized protein n=1 Tax=Flavobacterium subsaxonicum WB 4.1-42 = DSM 21790 TaxID=1121898 RepID=A0A0A2N3T6_9FLAO|nr:hypothetical protein [Flavobacterium subsaxonicum]KGO95110.1 hypothetical protein Q766_03135 [Flavobacterium subsaxonicum WB 4.1-42 = DSM 21790]